MFKQKTASFLRLTSWASSTSRSFCRERTILTPCGFWKMALKIKEKKSWRCLAQQTMHRKWKHDGIWWNFMGSRVEDVFACSSMYSLWRHLVWKWMKQNHTISHEPIVMDVVVGVVMTLLRRRQNNQNGTNKVNHNPSSNPFGFGGDGHNDLEGFSLFEWSEWPLPDESSSLPSANSCALG